MDKDCARKNNGKIHGIRPEQLSDGGGMADRGTQGGTGDDEIVAINCKHWCSYFRKVLKIGHY